MEKVTDSAKTEPSQFTDCGKNVKKKSYLPSPPGTQIFTFCVSWRHRPTNIPQWLQNRRLSPT